LSDNKRFIAKKEISVRAMLTMLSEALSLPALYEDTEKRNVEFEATLPDVRIDCLLFLTKEQVCQAKSGALKELGTINVLHIKAIGDSFTLEHLQTYLGEALILNSSTQIKESDQVVLLVICSESFPQVLNGKIFEFIPKQDEPWVYMNKNEWFFPVRILILNELDLTDENLAIYFPFVPFISNKRKFLEFFPKIATLEIPEVWKFYCDLFAQKTNPHYEEVRKMIFQLTPDDMIKAIESVPSEDVPEALGKMLNRVSEEQRIRTVNMILPHIPEERRTEIFSALKITPDDMIKAIESVPSEDVPEALGKMLGRVSEKQRIETLNILRTLISEDKLKEWAREILNGDKQKSTE